MIRSACYSNVFVYEMIVSGIPIMIRKEDSYVNATQILRAAGLAKPARTKVLEREVTRGLHEKVQGGYAGSQGTWIPLDSAIELAEEYGLAEACAPLFNYDKNSGEAEKNAAKTRRTFVPKRILSEDESGKI